MKSEGNLGSDALAEAHDAWWSVTAWDDRAHMEAYVNSDPHLSTEALLDHLCDEATFVVLRHRSRWESLPNTDRGHPHGLGRAGLWRLVWAAMGLWATLKHYPAWHGAKAFLTIVPWVMLGSVVAVLLAIRGPRLKPFFGAVERLFYVVSLAWLFVVSIDLARISG
jgi:hypothetical protein